jgi:hypothetical protein
LTAQWFQGTRRLSDSKNGGQVFDPTRLTTMLPTSSEPLAHELEHLTQGNLRGGFKITFNDCAFIPVVKMSGKCAKTGVVWCVVPPMELATLPTLFPVIGVIPIRR